MVSCSRIGTCDTLLTSCNSSATFLPRQCCLTLPLTTSFSVLHLRPTLSSRYLNFRSEAGEKALPPHQSVMRQTERSRLPRATSGRTNCDDRAHPQVREMAFAGNAMEGRTQRQEEDVLADTLGFILHLIARSSCVSRQPAGHESGASGGQPPLRKPRSITVTPPRCRHHHNQSKQPQR